AAMSGSTQSMPASAAAAPAPLVAAPSGVPEAPKMTQGTLIQQTLERPLRPSAASLDELERASREAETQRVPANEAPDGAVMEKGEEKPAKEVKVANAKVAAKSSGKGAAESEMAEVDKVAIQSIRVNVDTLEHLMTMVSELVLTRNQLLEI